MPYIKEQLLNAQFHNSASDLTPTSTGLVYINTSTAFVKYYNGSGWVSLVTDSGTQTLTNKTLTSPAINTPTITSPVVDTSISGTAVLDEDNMASNSDTQLATQQSIKAYSDSATQTMTNKTLTSPVLNGSLTGTGVKDEDDMVSDSNTAVPTQQSVKAFVTASITSGGLVNIRASEGAGTTTLTASDARRQLFNLSADRDCVLPTTTIVAGDIWTLENRTDFLLTVKSSAGTNLTISNSHNTFGKIKIGVIKIMALQNAPTTPAHWLTLECFEDNVYTPTLAGVINTNVAAAVGDVSIYSRNMNTVHVTANGTVDPTAASTTTTRFSITLPVPSDFADDDDDCQGIIVVSGASPDNQLGRIEGSAASDVAVAEFLATDTANRRFKSVFMYRIK